MYCISSFLCACERWLTPPGVAMQGTALQTTICEGGAVTPRRGTTLVSYRAQHFIRLWPAATDLLGVVDGQADARGRLTEPARHGTGRGGHTGRTPHLQKATDWIEDIG